MVVCCSFRAVLARGEERTVTINAPPRISRALCNALPAHGCQFGDRCSYRFAGRRRALSIHKWIVLQG